MSSENLVADATEDEQGRTSGNLVAGAAPVVPSAFERDLLAMGRIVMQPTSTESGTVLVPTWALIPGEFESVTNEDGETTQVPVTYEDEFVEGVNNWLKERGRSAVGTGAEAVDILKTMPAELDTIFSSIYEIAAMQYAVMVDGEEIVVNGQDLQMAQQLVPGTTIEDAYLAVRASARHNVPWETTLMAGRRPRTGEVMGDGISIEQAAIEMKEALIRFNGDELLAYLHVAGKGEVEAEGPTGGQAVFGRSLAEAIATDRPNLSKAEHKRLLQIMKPLNRWSINPQTTAVWDQRELDFLNELEVGEGSADPMENPYSRDTVNDQLRSLYQAWFQTDPTAADLENFQQHFNDQLSDYQTQQIPYDNPFQRGNQAGIMEGRPTLESASRTYLRSTPMYQDLYGMKPQGVNEETYMSQFQGAATRWLGSDAMGAGDAVRAGMRSGDVADVQRNIRSSGLGDDSPVYRNRLAALGQAMRRAD